MAEEHSDVIHQVMPQCSLFICGTIFKDLVELQGNGPPSIPGILQDRGIEIVREHLSRIVVYAKKNKNKADRSWPVLLKSNAFFGHVTAYLTGIRAKDGLTGTARLRTGE